MSGRDALGIVNRALQELGLPSVLSIESESGDRTAFQLAGLINALGSQIAKAHDWQFMEKTAEFEGDGVKTEFDLPADFGRQVNQTQWSSKNKRPMSGPMNAQGWSWIQYGIVSVGVYYRYRILGNKMHVFPTPEPGEKFHFYYISKFWVVNESNPAGPVWRDHIEQDSDIAVFDFDLMVAGAKFKIWSAKGMNSTELAQEFNYLLGAERSQNQGAPVISLDRRFDYLYINYRNIPDGGFNT